MSSRAFWQDRLERVGHTGWKDPILYAYDQLERLACVEAELDREGVRRGHALDFGCGTGDFSRLLIARGMNVVGYDPFVVPALDAANFAHVASLETLAGCTDPWNLILTVTVLDHILDAKELRATLELMRSNVSEDGVLLMTEYSLDTPEAPASDYQAFRATKTWRETLREGGWRIDALRPLPHPESAPSEGFAAYARHPAIRTVSRIRRRLPFAERMLTPFLPALARRTFDRFGPGRVTASPLKLHVCRPI